VPHFQEIAFVFDNPAGLGYAPAAPNPFTGKPQSFFDLATLMSKTWASFINSGNPNGWIGQGPVSWPEYSVSAPMDIVWDANVTNLAYAEPDTWRAAGIDLINSFNAAYQR
jgi:carboxylesterase type B